METLVHQIQLLVLRVFAGMLPAVCLAWVLAVLKSRGIHPVDRLKKTVASMPVFGRVLFGTLLVALVVYGSTKDGGDGTNEPPTRMSAPRRVLRPAHADAVAAEDIAHGWRVVSSAEAEAPVAMPEGAVTNDLLRRRGGFDWAFRVEPEGWRFPWRDGVLTGVTVLARGEVRPDVGTLYFPVPVTNGVSLLPEARWGLLPGGGASVFSHAATTNGSLILDWRNALVGRDVHSPTNLQLELYGDGRFVWRTEGGSTSYRPVLPFDWDGDGLENSVDPEPLVADAADAHGTNAEWYRVVCSNVFEIADTSNIQTFPDSNIPEGVQFRSGVNTNAYYFVDVVAANGPAPIHFTADRASRLGSPAVVARAGETNRVPLLIGVAYAVTSSVPIQVELPTNGFAEVISSCENTCTLRWPLNFDFSEGTGRTYTASLSPRDPGGTFTWTSASSGGGATLLSASTDSSCSCWTGYGPLVTFSCSPTCGCNSGCLATGSFHLEDASFAVSLDGCRCGFDDPDPDDDNAHEPSPEPTASPSLDVSFSRSAIIFEDAYLDAPDVWQPKRSTRVRLSISACGGANGASVSFSSQGLEKLRPIACGPLTIPTSLTLGPYQTYSAEFICEGDEESSASEDVRVQGTLTENDTGSTIDNEARLTVVRIELRPVIDPPLNATSGRHTYGVCEYVEHLQFPTSTSVAWTPIGGGNNETHNGKSCYRCPLSACRNPLRAEVNGVYYIPHLTVLPPQSVRAVVQRHVTYGLGRGKAGGIGMELYLYAEPLNVSFSQIKIQEVVCLTYDAEGYFTNQFFNGTFAHTGGIGGAGAGTWLSVSSSNRIGDHDTAAYQSEIPRLPTAGQTTTDKTGAWSDGYVYMDNPFGWGALSAEDGDSPFSRFAEDVRDEIMITPHGTVGVRKLHNQVTRTTNDVITLNGVVVQ